jgi:DNA-directed RNA polymerase subunit E'
LYLIYSIKDTISISPNYFDSDLSKAAESILRARYERTMDKEMGIILAVFNISEVSEGVILPGDPSTHHSVTFDVLAFNLEVGEIVAGEVSELVDFGCFVRLGPLDGLVHLSQITSDFITYDRKSAMFVLRNSGRSLKKGDVVYAKVSTISIKNNIKDTKIALTMRPEGLGKHEWMTEPAPKPRAPGGRDHRRSGPSRKRR